MGDRAYVHYVIGGELSPAAVEAIESLDNDYGEADELLAALVEGRPADIEFFEVNGGQLEDLETFCHDHRLWLWGDCGSCGGAFPGRFVTNHPQYGWYEVSQDDTEGPYFTISQLRSSHNAGQTLADLLGQYDTHDFSSNDIPPLTKQEALCQA